MAIERNWLVNRLTLCFAHLNRVYLSHDKHPQITRTCSWGKESDKIREKFSSLPRKNVLRPTHDNFRGWKYELPSNNFLKAFTTSVRCILFSASINLLTVRSGSTWTMYSIKVLVGLGFPLGFKLSQSSLGTPSLQAKCSQFFIPGVSQSNKVASSSKQSRLLRRVFIVPPSVLQKKHKKAKKKPAD